MELLVDPNISKQKFDCELKSYRELEDDYIKRGWWLIKATYPEVFIVFATPQLKPPSAVFGVIIDFTNYDFWPPSVRFVDPFTCNPYKVNELLSRLPYRVRSIDGAELPGNLIVQYFIQAHQDQKPFLCLPGVREYHEHPAHTGDSWLLHRGKGEGTLYFLLDKIYQYGVKPINGYQIEFSPRIPGFSFNPNEIP